MARYSPGFSWSLSILGSLVFLGVAVEIASAFTGQTGQSVVVWALLLLVVVPLWVWRRRRGHFPVFQIAVRSRRRPPDEKVPEPQPEQAEKPQPTMTDTF